MGSLCDITKKRVRVDGGSRNSSREALLTHTHVPVKASAVQIRFQIELRPAESVTSREREGRVSVLPAQTRSVRRELENPSVKEHGVRLKHSIFLLCIFAGFQQQERQRQLEARRDGRAAEVDALSHGGRHGRAPRPAAAYAGRQRRNGRRREETGHWRHFTANYDHHRSKSG